MSATPEQQKVLDLGARVRIVQAAPGSGKTWLVAEIVRRELECWSSRCGGIAALSFTRVAGAEIRDKLGHEVVAPPYVGTLDAFLFRFIVRPFYAKVSASSHAPRLIPADWAPDRWRTRPDGSPWTALNGKYHLPSVVFSNKEGGSPTLEHSTHGRLAPVPPADRDAILSKKRDLWKSSGWMTHSDAAYVASCILRHAKYGKMVRDEIGRRFPVIVVDEMQDTGYYLGECVASLIEAESVRGVLVGDADQAIYEFSGACPDLFAGFCQMPGASVRPLASSLRCPAAITGVACHLKCSGGTIGPAADGPGAAYLIECPDLESDARAIGQALAAIYGPDTTAIIARSNSTVARLIGSQGRVETPKLGVPAATHMMDAVASLRRGGRRRALGAARAAIDHLVFGHEGATELTLAKSDIGVDDWRHAALQALLAASQLPTACSAYEWQSAAGSLMQTELATMKQAACAEAAAKKLTLRKLSKQDWDKPASTWLPGPPAHAAPAGLPRIVTVHAAKGETHDATVFVVPESTASRCPSAVWWSAKPEDLEEKRIAYVAVTRAKRELVLCVDPAVLARLQANRPEFVASFQVVTCAEFLQLRSATGPSESDD